MPGTTDLDIYENAPSVFTELFRSLPREVQIALEYAYNNGYTFNDVYIAAQQARDSLRDASPQQVANFIGQAAGAVGYLGMDTPNRATTAGLTSSAATGGAIASGLYNTFITPSPTDREPPTISPDPRARRGPPLPNLQPEGQAQLTPQNWDWAGMSKRPADESTDAPVAQRAAGESSGPTSAGQGQRIAVIPRQPEMGPLTEQRTAVLPLRFYCSMNMLDHKAPVVLKIRINNHWDIFKNTALVSQTVNTSRNKGVSNDYAFSLPYGNDGETSQNGPELIPFPVSLIGGTAVTATTSSFGSIALGNLRPAWRTYYERNWRAYANYKTEYKITVLNSNNSSADLNNVVLLTETEKYTLSTGDTRLIPQNRPLAEALNWGMTKHNISPRNVNTESSDYTVIDKVWTPTSTRDLNVFNDEDVKTWTNTGAQNGLVHEDITILGYKHDMYPVAPRQTRDTETQVNYAANGTTINGVTKQWDQAGRSCINLRIDMKFHVVYKDLQRTLRYPCYSDADESIMAVHDQYQVPRNPEYVPNSAPNNTL
jgi:hypothetical protein